MEHQMRNGYTQHTEYVERSYAVVVIGGGLAGICAAITAARLGCKVALIHDRPVLGGAASSECRVPICGVNSVRRLPGVPNWAHYGRETGIIEEIILENRVRNPGLVWSIWDMILWEKCIEEPNLTLYLNSSAMHPLMKDEKTIESVRVWQSTTFTEFLLHSQIFIDASGDGHIAYEAGAEYRLGREGQDEFDESMAPAQPDTHTMGNVVYIQWRDVGIPVPFTPPKWAKTFNDADLLPMKPSVEGAFPENRFHGAHQLRMKSIGFWWIEYGGLLDVIVNAEEIRDELWKLAYGVWDKIKNYGDAAETLALEWVQSVPGKRESRRFIGDHILTQNDIQNQVTFPDRVAYGRHIIDLHPPGGIHARYTPAEYCSTKGLYSIPYRCLYSKDLSNLFLAGRIISVTHVALGTTREQRQTSIIGQVVGTAAALCVQYGATPREIYPSYITELQQLLLKQDCYILDVKNEDPMDLARNAQVIASSSKKLELEPSTETELNLFELTVPRGQMFLITEPQFTHVDLFLESRLSDDVELSLSLRAASSVTDFSSVEDLTITRATVPGTGQPQPVNQQPPIAPVNRSWVSFPLNVGLNPHSHQELVRKKRPGEGHS